MRLSQEGYDSVVETMSGRSFRNLGMADYVHDDKTRKARKRWSRFTVPEAEGFALALFYTPLNVGESTRSCCGAYDDIQVLSEEVADDWLSKMILLPVKWTSLTDHLTLGLRESFMSYIYEGPKDPEVAQAIVRFPHADIELGQLNSPLSGETELSLTQYGSMYVWHLTPVTEDEATLWVDAYNAAEISGDLLPSLSYNWCCGNDPVQELVGEAEYLRWKSESNTEPVCSTAVEEDILLIDGDKDMPLCTCCAYWDMRAWLHEVMFPSLQEYTNRVRHHLGPEYYDGVWNEAAAWFRAGLDVAHDMTHLIASEGGEEWASWWESRFLPEPCSGGANALPLAHQRFEWLESSA